MADSTASSTKSWRTTAVGWLGIVGSISAGLVLILNGHIGEGFAALSALVPSIGHLFAKDDKAAATN